MGLMDMFGDKTESSQSTTQNVDMGPWSRQQPFIDKGFRAADRWLKSGGPQFYNNQLTADRNPLINQSEDSLMGYFGGSGVQNLLGTGQGAMQGMLGQGPQGYGAIMSDPNVGGAYQQMLSGNPNPYTADAARSVRNDMMEDYSAVGGPASQIRNAQISSGQHGGSTRGDLMNRRGQDELDENMRQTTANMYQSAHENAQNRTLQGLGLAERARSGMGNEAINRFGAGMSQMPTLFNMQQTALGMPGRVGQARQAYDQQLIDDDREKWDFNQNSRLNNLKNYMGLIGGNYGQSGTTTNSAIGDRQSRGSNYDIGKGLFNDAGALASIGMGLF
jgi:hypothetical protein